MGFCSGAWSKSGRRLLAETLPVCRFDDKSCAASFPAGQVVPEANLASVALDDFGSVTRILNEIRSAFPGAA